MAALDATAPEDQAVLVEDVWVTSTVWLELEHSHSLITKLQTFIDCAPPEAVMHTRNLCINAKRGHIGYQTLIQMSRMLRRFRALDSLHLYFTTTPRARPLPNRTRDLFVRINGRCMCELSKPAERELALEALSGAGTGLVELYINLHLGQTPLQTLFELDGKPFGCGEFVCVVAEGIRRTKVL